MVRRARSVIAKQSGGCAYHGQACYNEAVERVHLPWSCVLAVPGRSSGAGVLCRVAGKMHAIECGFWSASNICGPIPGGLIFDPYPYRV